MSGSLLQRAEAIFIELAEMPRDHWESKLHERCAGDRELMKEVASLLDCHVQSETFLDASELDHLRPLDFDPSLVEEELPPGARIDEFVVQRFLGKGGMGNVYIAEQDRPRRIVALKVVRRSLATKSLLRRFEHEAEFLGRLHHPGIAQIYAAGAAIAPSANGLAPTSQPFIAMELVVGPPLNVYAQDKKLSTLDCMAILAKVCDAVHHAHQRGVIHRDLKPANILVDEHGQPKILDFGVARAADADIEVATMQTRVGQIIGTLPYMSPEQVIGNADEIDTRSDVYALGVLLYQLLARKLPLDVSSATIPEAARIIRDDSPTRLGQIDRAMRGDIETIAARALEKNKSRRYQSAADLADDLRRFIAGKPVLARQDSALYVLRKQINRNKGAVAAAICLVAAITIFAIYRSYQADQYERLAVAESLAKGRAELARDEADDQRKRADAATARIEKELSASNIERGRLLGRSGNLTGAENLLWPEHLRDIESHHTFYALWELYSHQRCMATLLVNGPKATKMRLSPDGRTIATCGREPAILIHDTTTLERTNAFGPSDVDHTAMAFSREGRLATADAKGRIVIWDPSTGSQLAILRQSGPPAVDIAFDRTGTRLAAALNDATTILLNAELQPPADRLLATRTGPATRSVAFNPIADELLLGSADSKVRIVSIPDLTTIREISNPDDGQPRIAYSPDGTLIAAGGSARLTRLWRVSTGELLATLSAPNGAVNGVAFSPDGTRLLVVGWWYLHVWDIASQRLAESFTGYRGAASDIAVSPDGLLAWTNLGTIIRAWDLDRGAGRTRIESTTARTLAVFTPAGELISGEGDGTVSLLTDPGAELITTMTKGSRRVRAITVSRDGSLAASIALDNIVSLFDLSQRKLIAQWPGYKMATNDGMRFDSTGERLVIPAWDDSFRIVSVPDGEVIVTIPAEGGEALSAAFSPDDRLIAVTWRRGVVSLYDARTGERVRELDRPLSTPWAVIFSPDGSQVIASNWSRMIDIWDVATGKLTRRLDGHRGLVTDIAFRPKEPHVLASSSSDGQVMLWDLSVPYDVPVLTLDALDGWEIWALDFDQRGRRLIATNSPGVSVIWDLRHFNRHIGGNMQTWIQEHRDQLSDTFDEAAALEQRRLLLTRGRREQEQPASQAQPPAATVSPPASR